MENIMKELTEIKGWGIDVDRENDPTYPIKHRTDEEQKGYSWPRPRQQEMNVEILHSIERPTVTSVFGTSVPPSGLSGIVRRVAFRYSEGSFAHWLPLLLADRVNVIEGIIDDLKKGIIPNLFVEKGGKASWKYNKKKIILNVLTGTAVATAIALYAFRNKINFPKPELEVYIPAS